MGLAQDIENKIETTFEDVEGWVVDIAKGAEVAAEDLEAGLNYFASQAPAIATLLQEASTMLKEIIAATPGLAQNEVVTQAVQDIDNTAEATNAFVSAANTGDSQPQALTAAYIAYQNANAAVASAKSGVVSAATAPAPAAPAS